MFKLIALLFVMNHGVPADQPSMVVHVPHPFASKDLCRQFLETDEGKEAKAGIKDIANTLEGDVAIKLVCVETKGKSSDDGKI